MRRADPVNCPSRWVGTFVDSDDAGLPGVGAGTDREPGIGAVTIPSDMVGVANTSDVRFKSS